MKRFYAVLLLLVFVSFVAAAAPRNRNVLKVRLSNRQPLAVAIDGRNYGETGRTITIGDLPAGRHRITIYAIGDNSARGRRRGRIVYQGNIRITPGTFTSCQLDVRSRSLAISTRALDREYSNNQDYYNSADEYYQSGNGNDNDQYVAHDVRNTNDNYNNDYGGNRNSFSSADLEDLRSRVAGRITDTDKESLMKQVLGSQRYETSQVRTMLEWLSFESTRLSFAKWAYSNVVDRNNYWKLEDAFSFSSSKTELSDFISDGN